MEDCLKFLQTDIFNREKAIKLLYSLIGSPDEAMPQSLFIYGHIATGKSLVIESLLKYLKYQHSIINCIEHSNTKNLFEFILSDLTSHQLDPDDGYKLQCKCDSIMQFIQHLKAINDNTDDNPIIIVFDKSERLRDMDANLLPAFCRLKELTGLNICTIFISDIVWEKFRTKTGVHEPIKIFFPQYTREEMAEILFLYRPKDYSDFFYKNYVNLFLSVFFRFCRDINELRYMAKVNFVKYIEPLNSGQCTEKDVSALWRNIASVLKANLEVIYLRVSTDDFSQRSQLSHEIESTTKLALSFELPYYAKYMLIAAYLASYNPPKEDKRLFMKQSSKKKKRSHVSKKTITMNTVSGPRPFPLDRMLAIFCAIIEEKVDLNANLLAQIPTMCQLGLLTSVGDNNLDEPKFKCSISYDFATVISKTVGFTIKNYLYDFMH